MWALLILVAAASSQTWMVRTSRMEGAAVNVKEAAADLRATAEQVAASGRLTDVAVISSQAFELNRRVVSAGLAAKVLDEADQ